MFPISKRYLPCLRSSLRPTDCRDEIFLPFHVDQLREAFLIQSYLILHFRISITVSYRMKLKETPGENIDYYL